ncbi:hypothetical protein CASFOL_009382 [Castilleja foliolosa]|uniref:UMP kinase n=1 Tax=Castilleja foliolosa TaxID=1961234 RepID=A0ABD3DX58_9LAMI
MTIRPQSNPFDHDPDPISISCKRLIDRDGIHGVASKRTRPPSACSGGDYRNDWEWSDAAIACLLEAYNDKFLQLSRRNLRARDWEEVAATVSERCKNQAKSVEQCKNKVDDLKKRYKLKRHPVRNGSVLVSHWPWFKQMEKIVDNSTAAKASVAVEGKSSSEAGRSYSTRPYKSGPINRLKPKPSKWRRVVFNISGAALAGDASDNIDPKVAGLIASEVSIACQLGVEVAIVVGGRNFFCGDAWVTSTGLDRVHCIPDWGLMIATVMNSILLLLQSALEKLGVQRTFSMLEVAEPCSRQRAIRHLEKGRVVIFGGIGAGMGNPLFSTDTAATLRASEMHADAVLKGTNVDYVYAVTPKITAWRPSIFRSGSWLRVACLGLILWLRL